MSLKGRLHPTPIYWTTNPAKTVAYSAYLIMPKIIGVVDFKKYVGLKEIKEEATKTYET